MAEKSRDPASKVLDLMERLLRGDALLLPDIEQTAKVKQPRARELAELIAKKIQGAEWSVRGGRSQLRLTGIRTVQAEWLSVVGAALSASISSAIAKSSVGLAMREAAKLVAQLSNDASKYRHMDRKFVALARGGDRGPSEGDDGLLRILRALIDEHLLEIRYVHFSGKEELLRLRPLSLVWYGHQLYLVGEATVGANGPHPFRVSRIREVRRIDTVFAYPGPSVYDPEAYFRNSFGVFISRDAPERIVVRLEPRWATFADTHRWHPTQKVRLLDDGRVEVEICVVRDPEVESWILGFGPEAEVVQPVDLRDRIAALHKSAAARYETVQPAPSPEATTPRARRSAERSRR